MRVGSAAFVLALVVFGAWLLLAGGLRNDAEPAAVLVDERAGVLHGIRFGESARAVRARLGDESDDEDGYFPAGARYTGPLAVPAPRSDAGSRTPPAALHYAGFAFLVSPTIGVYSMATLEAGARTRNGVRVGDRLDAVRRHYPGARCGELEAGEGRSYRWCRALVGRVRVFFGGDPIESLTFTRY